MKINQIIESTVTGSIAPVVMSMNGGKAHTRTKESVNVRGLQPAEKVIKGKAKKKGPYANSIIEEGKMKELDMDLKQLSDVAFKKKYKKTKQEVKDSLKEGKNKKGASPTKPVKEAHIEENDLIIVPGQGRTQRTGFVKHDPDRSEHEGETLKNSLHTITRAAAVLDKHLSTQDHFPEWVSEKIGAIKGMMTSVMDYMISKKEMERDPDAMEDKFAKQRPFTGGVVAGGIAFESHELDENNGTQYGRRSTDRKYDPNYGPTMSNETLGKILQTYLSWFAEYTNDGKDELKAKRAMIEFGRAFRDKYHFNQEQSVNLAYKLYCKGMEGENSEYATTNPNRYDYKKYTEGKKVDRMVKYIKKSEEKAGKSKKEAENIAWATANKKGMLDNKNKKKKAK
jgi:hypothetical protein